MTTTNPKEQPPAQPSQASELEARDLDKVVGGLKKTGGGPKSGVIEDPCGGGE